MNYSDLQAAITAWTGDSFTTSQVKQFITLAEARFNRELRTMDMEVRATATLTGEYIALPTDLLRLRAIELDGTQIAPATPQFLRSQSPYEPAGRPRYYTLTDGQIQFWPVPDQSYDVEVIYFQAIPALSDANTGNWLLTAHPDLYLAQCLAIAETFGWNDARAGSFAATAAEIIETINRQEINRRMGAMPMQMARPANAPRF